MYATIVIGHIPFPEGFHGDTQNTREKRAALCAKAREVSAVGRRPRTVSPETAAAVERNERMAARMEAGRRRGAARRLALAESEAYVEAARRAS
jgi:hypothetical protein